MTQTEYLKTLMSGKNITMRKLAQHIGCSYDTLRKRINSNSIQSLSTECFVRLCKTFDLTVDEFLSNADSAVDPRLQALLSPVEMEAILTLRKGCVLSDNVSVTVDELTLIERYRSAPEYQNAIKKLLGLLDE